MSHRSGNTEDGLASGLVGLGILLVILALFWWFKGLATVLRAFVAEPSNRLLWLLTIACLVCIALALITQGNGVFVGLAVASAGGLFIVAYRIVDTSSNGAGSPRVLDDVIRFRW